MGVKAVALANNHVTDYGNQGCCDTIDTLKNSGIKYVGAGESISTIKKSLTIELGGQKIGIYNVSETFFVVPDEKTAGANLYDEWIVLNEIKKLKETCDYLIVIYHGGAEYLPYPTPQTRTRFHRMADCGADFITAQHTHCIGCEEWYNGSYLLYGQGNFLFAHQKKYPNLTKEGLVTELVFSGTDVKIKHHLVNIVGNVLQYDANQDFSSFKERSSRIDDQDFIMDEFKKIKADDVMVKFLTGSKGKYPLRRILRKLFPNTMKKFIGRSFTRKQILLNLYALGSDRNREDVLTIWQYVLTRQ
jgi:poly-gamma-glutamate synthesis protein (capsule biosynthesis protein)